VPANLVAGVPHGVDPRAAAFTTLGAIALQGVRRAGAQLGERVVVSGLGLLGLITVQLLRAAGCQVFGIEPVPRRRELALELGAEQAIAPEQAGQAVAAWTDGVGADVCIVTAASSSDEIVNSAIMMLRRKGRVVPVGDVGLGLERGPLYSREADVLISTSYGPGRYDPSYEEGGVDYPIAYVRWSENRNMQEFTRLLGTGQIDVTRMIELECPLASATEAYIAVNGPEPPLAALLTYERGIERPAAEVVRVSRPGSGPTSANGRIGVAVVGAGGFVRAVHLPNLIADGRARVVAIANRSGSSAADAARLAGGAETMTDWRSAIVREDVDLVLIGTRHDTHAEIATEALAAGKAVFVEKPLGLSREQIDMVWRATIDNDRLAIGFNRPFAALAQQLHSELVTGAPRHVVYRVSAPLAPDHWLNDPATGGGRILGEACHMYDFANWLCGTPVRVWGGCLPAAGGVRSPESSSISIQYSDGSLATVHYSGAASSAMPKERVEVMCGGRGWVLDDFMSLISYDAAGEHRRDERRVDKGHATLLGRILDACGGDQPFEPGIGAAYAAQSVALAALEAIATGIPVNVRASGADA
jgi:predicted dehydrogenase